MNLSKLNIKKSFDAAATTYNEAAFIQSQASENLVNKFNKLSLKKLPEKIADLGSGTGYLAKQLAIQFPQADISCVDFSNKMLKQAQNYTEYKNISYINADYDYLPFGPNSMDLICSNFALQWSVDLNQTLCELARILKSNGYCLFTTLGPQTLRELNNSWLKIDSDKHANEYNNLEEIKKYLNAHDMDILHAESHITAMYFSTVQDIMRNLKAVGANYVINKKSKSLMTRRSFNLLVKYYEAYRNHINLLPMSYEIIYIIARKK